MTKSGNPARRGSPNLLAPKFFDDMYKDWLQHHATVLEQVRHKRPHDYLKLVVSLLKDVHSEEESLDEMSYAEILAILHEIRAIEDHFDELMEEDKAKDVARKKTH